MPRTARIAPGGMAFHVLNHGVARMQLFEKVGGYIAHLSKTGPVPLAPLSPLLPLLRPGNIGRVLFPSPDLSRFRPEFSAP